MLDSVVNQHKCRSEQTEIITVLIIRRFVYYYYKYTALSGNECKSAKFCNLGN